MVCRRHRSDRFDGTSPGLHVTQHALGGTNWVYTLAADAPVALGLAIRVKGVEVLQGQSTNLGIVIAPSVSPLVRRLLGPASPSAL